MPAHKSALAGLIGVAVLWGFSYVISAYLLAFYSPILLSFIRMVLTWFFILILLYRLGKLQKPTKAEWMFMLASSVFGTLIQQPFYFLGLQLSTAANASLIYAVAPLVAVFMERVFLKVHLAGVKLFSGILGFIGIVIIVSFGGGKFSLSLGDLWLLIAMLGMTASMMFTPILAKTLPLRSMNIYSGGLGILLMAPAAGGEMLFGSFQLSGSLWIGLLLILLALITATSGIWWTQGVAVIGPGTAAMFMNIPPFISLVAGHFILGDPIHGAQLIGGALVLVGVFISNRDLAGSRVPSNQTISKG